MRFPVDARIAEFRCKWSPGLPSPAVGAWLDIGLFRTPVLWFTDRAAKVRKKLPRPRNTTRPCHRRFITKLSAAKEPAPASANIVQAASSVSAYSYPPGRKNPFLK